jgi:surfactin synthase thioesterase subunit
VAERVSTSLKGARPGAPWIVWWRIEETPRVRLFCFPSAGRGAAPFRQWGQWLPAGVELGALRLPGREQRIKEPAVDDMRRLAREVAVALEPLTDVSFCLFGHCFGALLAFEVARELRRADLPTPSRLLVAALIGPSAKAPSSGDAELDVRERLRRLGGTDPAILAHRQLFNLIRPAVEADFRLTDHYRYELEPPLDVPITVAAGTADVHVEEAVLKTWQVETTFELDVRLLPADHFFSDSGWEQLARAVGAAVLEPEGVRPNWNAQ